MVKGIFFLRNSNTGWLGLAMTAGLAGCGGSGSEGQTPVTPEATTPQTGQGTSGLALRVTEAYGLAVDLQRFFMRPEVFLGRTQTPCSSGDLERTLHDSNANGLVDAGEVVDFQLHNCVLSGATISGPVSVEMQGELAELGGISFINGAIADFQEMSISVDGNTYVATGKLVESFSGDSTTGKNTFSSATQDGGSMVFVSGDKSINVSNYLLQAGSDSTNGSNTFALDADLQVTTSDGSYAYSVETTEDFQQLAGQTYPSSGGMTLSSASDGAVKVDILVSLVRISQDSDGDGTYETVNDYAWNALPSF